MKSIPVRVRSWVSVTAAAWTGSETSCQYSSFELPSLTRALTRNCPSGRLKSPYDPSAAVEVAWRVARVEVNATSTRCPESGAPSSSVTMP